MKYRKKPVVIEAVQYTKSNRYQINAFMGVYPWHDNNNNELIIETLEGPLKASVGDYIIKGIKGELYPCKSDIFEAIYEKVDEDATTESHCKKVIETGQKDFQLKTS
jgi:hypothetical protein